VLLKNREFSLVVTMTKRGAATEEVISRKPEVAARGGLEK
jgi:hypothetical protein